MKALTCSLILKAVRMARGVKQCGQQHHHKGYAVNAKMQRGMDGIKPRQLRLELEYGSGCVVKGKPQPNC